VLFQGVEKKKVDNLKVCEICCKELRDSGHIIYGDVRKKNVFCSMECLEKYQLKIKEISKL
jgi:hypothetical protein